MVAAVGLQQRANPEFFRRKPEVVGYDGSECAKGALSQAVDQARMIVIGTFGERPLMGVVLGSTPYKLLHRSPVPVLVVPVPEARGGTGRPSPP